MNLRMVCLISALFLLPFAQAAEKEGGHGQTTERGLLRVWGKY